MDVRVHDEHFPADAKDEDWLPVVGQRGWIVLMKDKRIRRIALEREALLSSGVRAFVLTAGNLQGPEMAQVFVANLRTIVHIARTRPAPFIAWVAGLGVRVYRRP